MKRLSLILCLLLAAACSQAQVRKYGVKVVKEYPHLESSYTQGLFFHDGVLYESTGGHGGSGLGTVDLATGEPIVWRKLARKYFGEGSVILDGDLYMLTWTNKVAFRYDAATLTYKATYSYPREGWGLTTDGRELIASDGSAHLYFMDAELKVKRKVLVTANGKPLRNLNELEWIDGKVWANVYLTDLIVIINPESGKVEGAVNCTGLLPQELQRPTTDVLNGIAVDDKGQIFLTGKNWPRMYQIELVRK